MLFSGAQKKSESISFKRAPSSMFVQWLYPGLISWIVLRRISYEIIVSEVCHKRLSFVLKVKEETLIHFLLHSGAGACNSL